MLSYAFSRSINSKWTSFPILSCFSISCLRTKALSLHDKNFLLIRHHLKNWGGNLILCHTKLNIHIIEANMMHYFSTLFFCTTLHVSNRLTVQYQESWYCIHSNWYLSYYLFWLSASSQHCFKCLIDLHNSNNNNNNNNYLLQFGCHPVAVVAVYTKHEIGYYWI